MDGRGPGAVRPDDALQLGEKRRVGGEVGRLLGAEEIAEVEAGKSLGRARGIAHRHAAGHRLLAVAARDLPDQLGPDRPRRIDAGLERVVPVLQELEDSVLAGVLPRHHARPGHRTERGEDRTERPRSPLTPQPGQVGQDALLDRADPERPRSHRPAQAQAPSSAPVLSPVIPLRSRIATDRRRARQRFSLPYLNARIRSCARQARHRSSTGDRLAL